MKTVLTIGTFDLFHLGHLRLLERAAEFGRLEVGVNTDEFVASYKGRPPVVPFDERREIVEALRCVTIAPRNDGPGRDLIREVMPDLLVIGMDWHGRYLEQIDPVLGSVREVLQIGLRQGGHGRLAVFDVAIPDQEPRHDHGRQ